MPATVNPVTRNFVGMVVCLAGMGFFVRDCHACTAVDNANPFSEGFLEALGVDEIVDANRRNCTHGMAPAQTAADVSARCTACNAIRDAYARLPYEKSMVEVYTKYADIWCKPSLVPRALEPASQDVESPALRAQRPVADSLLRHSFAIDGLKNDAAKEFKKRCADLSGTHVPWRKPRSYYSARCEGLGGGALNAELVWKDRWASTNPGKVFQVRVDIWMAGAVGQLVGGEDSGKYPATPQIIRAFKKAKRVQRE